MKKIISCIILIFCLLNVIFSISVVYAEENIEYIQLPIISDKSKEAVTDITLYKDGDILYAPLHTICPLINAQWHMKDGGFYVERDSCTYFRYYSNGNMKFIVDLSTGDEKWNKSDNVLLEGDLFPCKKIGEEWCVDFIKFCDMFGVTIRQVSSNTIQAAKDNIKNNIDDSAIEKLNEVTIENDLNFINHPYYIYLYSGTPLISLYSQVMKDKNVYLWDYSCYENLERDKEGDSWFGEILKNIQYSSISTGLTVQSQNWLSNLINDDWGITKIITAPPYESSEHYKKTLVSISSINYSQNLKLEDIESINKNNKAEELERLLNSNTIISSSDSTMAILSKYLNTQIDIPELEAFTKVSDVINWIGTPFQTYFEIENFYDKLNNINEEKIQLLTKSIIQNEYINEFSKIQEKGNNALNFLNKTMANNIILNSIDNYTGLVDSSKEICSFYKNNDKQFEEKLSKSIESELYALGDSAISTILEKSGNPYLVLTGAVIGVYDGFTAWTKENFGEQLQSSEILVQAYFIERTMKECLDIKKPENLYNRLTLMLQSSLCCFEYDKNYFESNRNSISTMLYKLDNDKNINLNYYHDPRNDNVYENVKNAILNYSDNKVEETENYTWHLDPTIEADNIIVPDYDNELFEKYAIIEKNGKYGLISNTGELIEDVKYKNFLICPLNIYVIGNGDVSDFELNNKENIGYKIENEKLIKTNHIGHGIGDITYYYYNINDNKVYAVPQIGNNYKEYKDSNVVLAQSVSISIKEDGTYSCNNIYDDFYLVNNNGKINSNTYENGNNYYFNSPNNIIYAKQNNEWYYFNNKGEQIIFDNIESNYMENGHIQTNKINKNNIINYPFSDVENVIAINTGDNGIFYDIKGNRLTNSKEFEEVRPMINGFAWVKKDGKWGVIKFNAFNSIENYENLKQKYNKQTELKEEKKEKWKMEYTEYIKGIVEKDSYIYDNGIFVFVNIDGDDIPEIFYDSGSGYGGSGIITYSNEKVVELHMGNSSHMNYIEGENIFKYSGGHMDSYYDKIYTIKNGEFILIYDGNYGASDNANIQFDSDGNPIYNYYWNDVKVSKEEYNNLINEIYDNQSGINVNELKGNNYNDILKIIENYPNSKYESDKQSNNANQNNTGTVKIEDGYLNVRETPSTKGKIIAKLYNGDKITIEETSEDGKWYKISKGDIKGYVSKNYVKTN